MKKVNPEQQSEQQQALENEETKKMQRQPMEPPPPKSTRPEADEPSPTDFEWSGNGVEANPASVVASNSAADIKFSVGAKLAVGFGVMALFVVLVGSVALMGLNSTNKSWVQVKDVGLQLVELGDQVEIHFLEALASEKAFLLSSFSQGYEKAYQEYIQNQFLTYIYKVEAELVSIATVAKKHGLDEEVVLVTEMNQEMKAFEAGVLGMTELVQKRGDVDSGLFGKMGKNAHQMDERLEQLALPVLQIDFLKIREVGEKYLLTNKAEFLEKHALFVQTFKRDLGKSSLDSFVSSELASQLDQYDRSYLALIENDKAFEQQRVFFNQKGEALQAKSNELVKQGYAHEKRFIKEAMNVSKSIFWFVLSSILVSIIAGGVVAFLIGRGLSLNLKVLVQHMAQVATKGDLTQEVEKQSSDEVGLLATSFNHMRMGLKQIVSGILQSSLKINSSSNEILAAANQHESTTSEQSAQMNQIQATITQAATTGTELSRTAQEVAKFAKEIEKSAQDGGQAIEETQSKMSEMKNSNDAVSNKLKTLSEKIEGINKMLATILEVADQTNLLSLNAAIEASKAGEHGKGFSVVAQEIRRLADQTSQSSSEISNIINEIQAASSSAIMVTEKSMHEVSSGSELVTQLSDRFSGITQQVEQILPQIENVSESITQLASGNTEVSRSVKEMTESIRFTATAAKQTRQSATDLTSMAQDLRASVAQFKLK